MTSGSARPIPMRPALIAFRKACLSTVKDLSHHALATKMPPRKDAQNQDEPELVRRRSPAAF
jgi:hypothetical protein